MQQLPYLLRIGPVAQSHLCRSSFVVRRIMTSSMDKLELTGRNLGRVFNFRSGRVHAMKFLCQGVKLTNLKLKIGNCDICVEKKILVINETKGDKIVLKLKGGNTKGGRITVPLTSCLTGLESAV
jgi:hypothetical protein